MRDKEKKRKKGAQKKRGGGVKIHPFHLATTDNYKCEDYLHQVTNTRHRIALTKLRLSNHKLAIETYLLLTEFEGRTVSYGPSFFLLDFWPKREARGP